MNASMKQAEWIHKQLANEFKETADDVFDVLLGNIHNPIDFVQEVKYWAVEYERDYRSHNGR